MRAKLSLKRFALLTNSGHLGLPFRAEFLGFQAKSCVLYSG